MSRTREAIIQAMAAAGRLTTYDEGSTWRDALFDRPDASSPYTLSLPDAPDRALLAALAAEYVEADEHAASLSRRLQVRWLEDILRVERLSVVPDRVVAHAEVDPALAPAVIPLGTVLRGGKDSFGRERRYRTIDALTAHGAALLGVRSLFPGGTAAGEHGVASTAPPFTIEPSAPLVASAFDAPHRMRVCSPILAFESGRLTAKLDFAGTSNAAVAAFAATGSWTYPLPDATVGNAGHGTVEGSSITIALDDGCVDPQGGDPWVEFVVDPGKAVDESFSFSGISVSVTARRDIAPQAAFHNDGLVDVSKEFQPFGAVPLRGDAFYLRCDEALSKPLWTLTVSIANVDQGGLQGMTISGVNFASAAANLGNSGTSLGDEELMALIIADISILWPPRLVWQRRKADGGWETFAHGDSFATVLDSPLHGQSSAPFAVGNQPGRYIRAFLSGGDFGWADYQRRVADFATKAAKGAGALGSTALPSPPVPPIAAGVTLSYKTLAEPATRIESISGWRRRVKVGAGGFSPFRKAVTSEGHTGMIAIGLDLPAAALGSTVSLYADVDSSPAWQFTGEPDARWEWWDGDGWQTLLVADGSRSLREAGLVRFVAPPGWAQGTPDLDVSTGRWVRLVTHDPSALGAILGIHTDAVLAEFVSSAADPQTDPSPDTLLPPRTIKGTLTPIRGVRKVTNLASVRGRGPEADAAFVRRAAALVRHRDRALTAWDYEQLTLVGLPEVAAVRCLPHTDGAGQYAPGRVALVVVPDRRDEPQPRPSVSLSGRIVDALRPRMPIGAQLDIAPPDYLPVTVSAKVRLRRGVAALTGKAAVTAGLDALLHPLGTTPTRWGRGLYASALIAGLEKMPEVDVVLSFAASSAGAVADSFDVDPDRGLYCSAGDHVLECEEQL